MNIRFRIIVLLFFTSFSSLGFAAFSEGFPKLKKLDGVEAVEYGKPFLWVVALEGVDLLALRESVEALSAEQADLAAPVFKGRYKLHVCSMETFESEKAMYDAIRAANTRKGMSHLYELSNKVALYNLDWSEEYALQKRVQYVSKPYKKRSSLSAELAKIQSEKEQVNKVVEAYRNRKKRPSKIICFITTEFKELIYPVFGDSIKVGSDSVSYKAFEKRLKESAAQRKR